MSGRSIVRQFDEADERNEFDEGFVDLVSVGGVTFGQETLTPSWRWSKHVRPIAGTERCEFHHVGYQLSGRWIVEDRDELPARGRSRATISTLLRATMPRSSATSRA